MEYCGVFDWLMLGTIKLLSRDFPYLAEGLDYGNSLLSICEDVFLDLHADVKEKNGSATDDSLYDS